MVECEGEFGFILKVCQGTARTSTHINTLCHNSGALPFFFC